MKKPSWINWIRKYSFILLLASVLPFRLFHFNYPILDAFNFRQAQTATFALNFYKNGINLFQTELDIFGMGKERFLTLEFPLYEAIVAILYKIFFVSDLWGRAVSITSGFLGAWFLYRLTKLLIKDELTAFFSSFFFLFAPLNMFYQRTFMMEPFVICLLLAGVYYYCHWVDFQDTRSYVLSIFLLGIGFIHKGLYGPFWLLPMVVYYMKRHSFRKFFDIKFFLIIIIPLLMLFFWQKHVNNINVISGNLFFTTGDLGHQEWNFGLLSDRLIWSNWQFRLQQLINGIFLKPAVIFFLIGLAGVFQLDRNNFFLSWLVSQIIYFLVLFRIQQQNYYQMIMVPVFSIFIATGFVKIIDLFGKIIKRISMNHLVRIVIKSALISFFCVFYIYKSWINTQPSFYIDWDWYYRLKKLSSIIPSNSYSILITPGVDWNPVYTYIPGRKMKQVQVESLSLENIKNWKNDGYSFVVLHEYEKYPEYLAKVKPGYSLSFLDNYRESLSITEFKIYDLR